jgi:hypothetical protein
MLRHGVAAGLLFAGAVAATACGGSGTTASAPLESAPWGALGPSGLDDSPDGLVPLAPSGDPGPQVMAEVTLPGGGVPTVPQPSVPAPEVFVTPDLVASVGGGRPAVPTTAVPTTAPPPPAGGARAVERLGDDGRRATAARALGLVDYDWQRRLPGWQIRFLPGRSGVRGLTYPDARVIEVFVRDSDSPESLAHVVAHELGHAVDVTHLDEGERAAWRSARGIDPGRPWFPGASGASDFSSGAGDFAESFAWRTAGGGGWYSDLGPPPDAVETAILDRLGVP